MAVVLQLHHVFEIVCEPEVRTEMKTAQVGTWRPWTLRIALRKGPESFCCRGSVTKTPKGLPALSRSDDIGPPCRVLRPSRICIAAKRGGHYAAVELTSSRLLKR
jgi:hypothetical protein